MVIEIGTGFVPERIGRPGLEPAVLDQIGWDPFGLVWRRHWSRREHIAALTLLRGGGRRYE